MTHKNIAAALAAAQASMGKALKQSNNPHFRSKYADLGNVMDACMPALNANGIAVVQAVKRENGEIALYTLLRHADSGEWLEDGGMPLIVNKNDMQGLGSAITYARRYGLMAMVGIAPEDDDGNAAAKAPPAPSQKPAEPPAEAIEAARSSLFNADSLDVLKAIFVGLPASVRSLQAVIDAKDARKAELETAPADNADLGGDFIPH